MERLTTNGPSDLSVGRGQYAAVTDDRGVMLDDTVVYRRGPESFLFVPNAGHDGEMDDRWCDHRDEAGLDATVTNVTEETAMFAVQGPESIAMVDGLADANIAGLGRFETTTATLDGVDCLVANTGYTGERGVEVLLPWEEAESVWAALDCQPCGLGARDTLRMEMGFLLSGQDFDPEENPRTPYEAGIGFVVDMETDFVGRDALESVARDGPEETFVGIVLRDRGVPRHGYDITTPDGDHLGTVTSGTVSPTLEEPIGLGYLPVEYADEGTAVRVVVRGEPKRAVVRELPFVER
jgi:aminomethyltransferase